MSLRAGILSALAGAAEGLSENELARELKLPKSLKKKVERDLLALIESGQVTKTARHRYRATALVQAAKGQALSGIFAMSSGGAAFAKGSDGKDYYIPERVRGWALPEDEVELKLMPPRRGFGGARPKTEPGQKPGAEVVRVLKRGRSQWVGRLRREGNGATVEVAQGEMLLELEASKVPKSVPEGEWVVISAPGLDKDGHAPEPGVFQDRLGGDGSPHLDTLILIKKHGLKEDFDAPAVAEAEGFAADPPEDAKQGRLDLRGQVVFTIDGADAKDFDDAVSIEELPDGWRLGVHIADVSHYVKPGSALDKEAYERATSVYLPDRVLPMLPEALSNGLCSLKPDVDRLTMSAMMDLDRQGKFRSWTFANSVIRSARRFTYEELEEWFEGRAPLGPGEEEKLGPTLKSMRELALKRRKQRELRGALDFNFPETKAIIDKDGKPLDLVRRQRLFTHQLIEEFMLAANEAVATELHRRGLPLLFRVHEDPDPDKLDITLEFLGKLKLGAPKGKVSPIHLQKILAQVAGKPEERLVSTLLLRSLRLARYSPERDIHFGLALEDYCHFTSPIRRYPDLVVHRMLKLMLANKAASASAEMPAGFAEAGEHCSFMERKAEACERDCIKAKQVRFLETKLGQSFAATVTSVTRFGMFCEINLFPAEGLVHVSSLKNDYFDFDERNYTLVGARTKKKYSIGDQVTVVVKRADWESLKVDFELGEAPLPRKSGADASALL